MRKLTRRDALLGLSAAALTIPCRGSIAATLDFSSLQSRFSGDLITPESASYEKRRRTNNLAFDRRPVLIARCTNTNDVVRVLDFARSHHLPLAVRGGGHSLAGYSSCDGGVVIDLERIDAVSVDPRRQYVAGSSAGKCEATQDVIVNLDLCWSGDAAHGPNVIAQHITSVIRPNKDSTGETTLAQLAGNEVSPAEPQCTRFGNVAGQLPQIALDRLMDGGGAPAAAVRVIFFDPIHGVVTRSKPDATSFPHRPQGAAAGLILSWRDPANTAEVRAWADRSWATLQP